MKTLRRQSESHVRRRRGAAFIIALLVTTMLAGLVLIFARSMKGSAEASRSEEGRAHAQWIVRGALEAVCDDLALAIQNGEPPRLTTVGVQAQPLGEGLYWIIGRAKQTDDVGAGPEDVAFGLVSEAGKLNLNQAEGSELRELPGMTDSLVQTLDQYINREQDADEPGQEQAENSRVTLQTVDELLRVPGFTAEILDGEDANRNGVLDPNEDDGDASLPADNGDGRLDRGLRDFVTVYSREANTSNAGQPRVFLNRGGQGLGELLQASVEEDRYGQLVSTIPPNRPFQNVLDFFVRGGLEPEEFAKLHDKVTVDGNETMAGRIDVYAAPPEVLDAEARLEPGDGALIVAARPQLEGTEAPGDFAWLIEAIGQERAVAAGRALTHRSLQFSVDILATDRRGRGFVRQRYVIDCLPLVRGEAAGPRVLMMQDLTSLGWPLDPEILTALRQGSSQDDMTSRYGADAI